MDESIFLGVDGGGSKTTFVLITGDGNLVASHEGPSSYHVEIGLDGLRRVLVDGLAVVLQRGKTAGTAVAHAFFGLPAHGEDSAIQPLLDSMPESLLGHRRYHCGNDMVCAWAGSLAGRDGINIVAGTGSIAYGERLGRSARAGGWGEMFGDEGSAYWIAVRGLNLFTRMSDGRLPKGPLHEAFRSRFALSNDLDLCARVLSSPNRRDVAGLSRLVTRAAQDGDVSAGRILQEAARELAAIVEAVRHALGYAADELVPLSYSGGMFKAGALIVDPLRRCLGLQGRYRFEPPMLTPGVGAAIYAAKVAGKPLSAAAMQRLAALTAPT